MQKLTSYTYCRKQSGGDNFVQPKKSPPLQQISPLATVAIVRKRALLLYNMAVYDANFLHLHP